MSLDQVAEKGNMNEHLKWLLKLTLAATSLVSLIQAGRDRGWI
jgi:hypothetical protein